MAAISDAAIRLSGSHAGVSIGEDGPSQMALEDLAMMRAVCGSTVLYPCDANQTARLLALMAETRGISYLRTTRGKTDVIYDEQESFIIGGSKVLRQSERDDVAVVSAGITVHETLKAYEQLDALGVRLRVIDAYSVKPIDRQTLLEAVRATGGPMIVVEDHWAEGGLGAAVLEALAADVSSDGAARHANVVQLAVREMPGSGKPEELLAAAGIDADHIAAAARALIQSSAERFDASGRQRFDQAAGIRR
jgi:transketolase